MSDAQPEPVTDAAPRRIRPGLLTQVIRDVAFLHWPVDPADVRPLLPPGTRPDLCDGVTWVGLVGLRMERVTLGGGPALPYLGRFCQTNVRLYSVDEDGRRGVVFRSLDAERLLPALVGRVVLGLPYAWARMRLEATSEGAYRYRSRRRWPGGGTSCRFTVRPDLDPLRDPTPLERFLTARWGLHTRLAGRTAYLPNEHRPWPLHRAELRDLDDELVVAAGLPTPVGPPASVLWSPGVAMAFGPARPPYPRRPPA